MYKRQVLADAGRERILSDLLVLVGHIKGCLLYTSCVFDTETTGLDPGVEYMTEIGGVIVRNGEVMEEFDTFVKPGKPITPKITEITGITNAVSYTHLPQAGAGRGAGAGLCGPEGADL